MTTTNRGSQVGFTKAENERASIKFWGEYGDLSIVSVETLDLPSDKYEIANFCRDDWPRFVELVNHLSPRDQEIMYLYAVLHKRPTDLSRLFGKAGHRAEEDLHKAAHKLAGLIAFGPLPRVETIECILKRYALDRFGSHSLAA